MSEEIPNAPPSSAAAAMPPAMDTPGAAPTITAPTAQSAAAVSTAAAQPRPAAGASAAAPEAGDGQSAANPPAAITAETYQPFSLPDGMAVDTGLLGQFHSVAADLGLTQDQAQRLIDLRVQQAQQESAAAADQSRRWAEEARRDPEFGGARFQTALAVAERGLAAFATPDLRAILDQTGLGNHPEVIRLAYRIGRSVAEPGPVQPGAAAAEAMTTAEYYSKEVFGK